MQNFIIEKLPSNLKVKKFPEKLEGFHYCIKNHTNLKINEIVIVNPQMMDWLIFPDFNRRYRKILEYYLSVIQDDESDNTEGNLLLALDELTRLRNILIRKYHHLLSKKMEVKLLKKIKILENEIRTKIVDIKLIKEQELVHTNIEEKSRGR